MQREYGGWWHGRGDGPRPAGEEAGQVYEVDQLLQLLDPLPVELNLLDARDGAQGGGLTREGGRLGKARGTRWVAKGPRARWGAVGAWLIDVGQWQGGASVGA